MESWKELEYLARYILLRDDAKLTPGSGNVKGEEDVVGFSTVCQCKYTDNKNISILSKDIERLIEAANLHDKTPIFIAGNRRHVLISLLNDDITRDTINYLILVSRLKKLKSYIQEVKDADTLQALSDKARGSLSILLTNVTQKVTVEWKQSISLIDKKIDDVSYDLFKGEE